MGRDLRGESRPGFVSGGRGRRWFRPGVYCDLGAATPGLFGRSCLGRARRFADPPSSDSAHFCVPGGHDAVWSAGESRGLGSASRAWTWGRFGSGWVDRAGSRLRKSGAVPVSSGAVPPSKMPRRRLFPRARVFSPTSRSRRGGRDASSHGDEHENPMKAYKEDASRQHGPQPHERLRHPAQHGRRRRGSWAHVS